MKPTIALVLPLVVACSSSPTAPAGDAAPGSDAAPAADSALDSSAFDAPGDRGAESTTSAAADSARDAAPDSPASADATSETPNDSALTYDQVVLADGPVAFWDINQSTTEPDRTGNGNAGTYKGGQPTLVAMPNGDQAGDFNGSSEYLSVPSNASFSIPTTGDLTWEGWIRPDVLQFPHETGGYVDWMGKCDEYSPTCEWESRMYDNTNSQGRYSRMSAYVFNPSAGLGSAADWQPATGLITAGSWYYVVGEYTLTSEPSSCASVDATCDGGASKGSINIWVNGVVWSQTSHNPTGCMSQYCVVPVANTSTLQVGTMAGDSYFQGAIGKVALYDRLLTAAQIATHYQAMTGKVPTGTCGNTCAF